MASTAATDTGGDRYDAFISYKRTDIAFARLLEKALNAYAPPKALAVPQRRLRIFRDEGDLTGTEYFKSIDGYLARADKLIVICSPAARQSTFVDDEIRRYIAHHGPETLIPILLAGVPNNEATPEQAAEQAFPQALTEALEMPLAVNYHSFDPAHDKVDRGKFEGSWYTLLANLYGLPRDEIEQRDRVRRQRRRNLLIGVMGSVTLVVSALAVTAWMQKLAADEQRNVALRGLANYLAGVSGQARVDAPQTGLLLAVEAVRATRDADGSVTPQAQGALREALAGASGQPLGTRAGRVSSAMFSADGGRVATLDRDGRVDVWDLATPDEPPRSLQLAPGKPSLRGFSADGRLLLMTQGDQGEPLLWDLAVPGNAPIAVGQRMAGERLLRLASNGHWLASVDNDARVHLRRPDDLAAPPLVLSKHQPRRDYRGQPTTLQSVAFDPAAQWMFSAGYDKAVFMWDLGARPPAPQPLAGGNPDATAVFSADGLWLAQIVRDGNASDKSRLGVWRLDQGQWRPVPLAWDAAANATNAASAAEAPAAGGTVQIIGFLPGAGGIAALVRDEVRIWQLDASTGAAPAAYRAWPATAAAISPDGAWLATVVPGRGAGDPAYWVRVQALTHQEDAGNVAKLDARVAELAFDAHGRRLAIVTEDGRVRIATPGSEDGAETLRGPDVKIGEVRFSANGRWLFATPKYGGAGPYSWPVRKGGADPLQIPAAALPELEYKTPSGGGGGVPTGGLPNAVAVDPQGRWIAMPGREHGTAQWVDLADPAASPRILPGHSHDVTALAFGPDGKWLATADWNHTVRIWRPPDLRQPVTTLARARAERESSVSALAVSPDGSLIATGGEQGEVLLWKPGDARAAPRVLTGHDGWITNLDFSPDGRQLLSAGVDGKVQMWTLDAPATARPLRLDAHQGVIFEARFFDGGRRFMTAGEDSLIRIWTPSASGASPVTLRGHESAISSVGLDTGGRWLVTGSEDGTVRLWDLQAPDAVPLTLGLRGATVNVVSISPDGASIAAGYLNGYVRVWRRAELVAGTLTDPTPLPATSDPDAGKRGAAWALRFSPDGRWLAALAGGDLRLWHMRMEEQLALACRIAGRNLREAIWQRHLERVPYRLSCPPNGLPPEWMADADRIAGNGDVARATALYEAARKIDPSLKIDPKARATQQAVEAELSEARSLARRGEKDAALAAYAAARRFDPAVAPDPAAEMARLAKAQALVAEAGKVAAAGNVEPAVGLYQQARALDDGLDIDPVATARKLAAPRFVRQGDALAQEGRMEEAVAAFQRAVAFGVESDLDPQGRANNMRAHVLAAQAEKLGGQGDQQGATRMYEEAMALDPSLRIDPVAAGRKSVVAYYIEQAGQLAGKREIAEAAAMYRHVRELDPAATLPAYQLNELCWQGGQQNLAREVLDMCDLAVLAQPGDGGYRDSRGVVRALLNDRRGAIDDFTAYLGWASSGGRPGAEVESRRRWIAFLQRGGQVKNFQQLEAMGAK